MGADVHYANGALKLNSAPPVQLNFCFMNQCACPVAPEAGKTRHRLSEWTLLAETVSEVPVLMFSGENALTVHGVFLTFRDGIQCHESQ